MFGLSIVALVVLHLFAVAFLYNRVPATDTSHAGLRSSAAAGMEGMLKKSRDSLKKTAVMSKNIPKKKQQELKPRQEPIKHFTAGNKDRTKDNDSRAKKKQEPKRSPDFQEQKEGKDDDQNREKKNDIVEKKTDAVDQDEQVKQAEEETGGVEKKADTINQDQQQPDIDKQAAESLEAEEKGNRVTDRAYIGDFAFEREHPAFRTHELVFPELDERVQSPLESCTYVSSHRLLTHAACRNDDTLLTAFNSQPFPRYWCGKLIAPDSVERFDEPCHEPVRLFPMTSPDAPVNGKGMAPVTITEDKGSTNLEDVSCDIPCQQQVGMEGITRYIEGTDWKITTTEKDPATVREAKIDGNAYRNDQYYSTASFMSSVPLSPFSFDNYNLTVPAVDFNDTLASASYLIDSSCSTQASKRHRWVGAIQKHFPVAFYGSCSHNTDLPDGMSLSNREDRVKLHRKHRFNLAFESSNEKDYITETIFDAFQSGSLPVVLGPSNIESHFPPNSFINAGSFQYWDDLGKYVKQVAENKTLWESYFEWRKDPDALNAFRERFSFTKTPAACRTCRWAYAKMFGLGWDHVHQEVQENVLSRDLCVDSELVTKPFVESYLTKSGDTYEEVAAAVRDSSSCQTGSSSLHAAFDLNGYKLERSVEAHDGVTDLIIDHINRPSAGGDFILQLEFGVKNTDGASFRNPHTLVSTTHGPLCSSIAIHDDRSKVTVLANWETEMISTREGVIGIVVNSGSEGNLQEDETRKIRIIVEDTDVVRDKLSEYYPSSYGKLMIHDFVDPLEFFYNTN